MHSFTCIPLDVTSLITPQCEVDGDPDILRGILHRALVGNPDPDESAARQSGTTGAEMVLDLFLTCADCCR